MNNKLKRKSCENNVQLRPNSKKQRGKGRGVITFQVKNVWNMKIMRTYVANTYLGTFASLRIHQIFVNLCVKNGYISVGLSVDISIGLKSLSVENWILVYLIYTIGLS